MARTNAGLIALLGLTLIVLPSCASFDDYSDYEVNCKPDEAATREVAKAVARDVATAMNWKMEIKTDDDTELLIYMSEGGFSLSAPFAATFRRVYWPGNTLYYIVIDGEPSRNDPRSIRLRNIIGDAIRKSSCPVFRPFISNMHYPKLG